MIRNATLEDAGRIADIYNHYIEQTVITFEEEPVTAEIMATRIQACQDHGLPWLVLEASEQVIGFAYAGQWITRPAYRYSVEVTVYLEHERVRRGQGSRLYEALFAELRGRGIHTAIGLIALPNDASVALHEKMGMEKVAHLGEVGFKFGRWLDVGYWQGTLNAQ
ncbi:phosphinothricin acetyltransferase [Onishia taeanensis]|jgi:phosphinothricin acetyltransferase|uniref:Phosphinothricin acetyltransferase n=1 Tax=Onishia taeanensis TaxID=284577 RepID=A0A1G7U7C1_9GAMM|nr:arsinothricin resistance N-acetyltransferase ArsN1 family B [Halomonas taeanensis]SDG43181.1 phosphinothricin acetyltransferase [Halomonas taeanensis]